MITLYADQRPVAEGQRVVFGPGYMTVYRADGSSKIIQMQYGVHYELKESYRA